MCRVEYCEVIFGFWNFSVRIFFDSHKKKDMKYKGFYGSQKIFVNKVIFIRTFKLWGKEGAQSFDWNNFLRRIKHTGRPL